MVSDRTVVGRIYRDISDISGHLGTERLSFSVTADEIFSKYLLVASASYFEERVKGILLDYVRESTGGNERLVEFIRNTVTARGYHTLFDWNGANANQFWRLFGESFRARMRERVRQDANMDDGIKAFLELTRDRNRLVHGDIGAFSFEKTSDEIYEAYTTALEFVETLPQLLRESAD